MQSIHVVRPPGHIGTMHGCHASSGERRIGNTNLVRFIAERFGLPPGLAIEQAVDMVWALTAFELADRLVRRCGWSLSAYERWLGDLLVTSLCSSGRAG
jgi:hypothetical protein